MVEIEAKKSYANFGLGRSVRQFKHALDKRRRNDEGMATLLRYVQESEQRIQRQLGPNNTSVVHS